MPSRSLPLYVLLTCQLVKATSFDPGPEHDTTVVIRKHKASLTNNAHTDDHAHALEHKATVSVDALGRSRRALGVVEEFGAHGSLLRKDRKAVATEIEPDAFPGSNSAPDTSAGQEARNRLSRTGRSPQAQQDKKLAIDLTRDGSNTISLAHVKDGVQKEVKFSGRASKAVWIIPLVLFVLLTFMVAVYVAFKRNPELYGRLQEMRSSEMKSTKSERNSPYRRKAMDATGLRMALAIEAELSHELPRTVRDLVKADFLSEQVAVLVSDMSGFTRLTREHGVVHFASIIIRFRQICLPILHHFKAKLIDTEGDDFIVMFPNASLAVAAAHSMMVTIDKHNKSLREDREHFTLTLNGIGVACGPGPLVDKHGKMYGTTVRHAYMLGEDLCESGQILITGNVHKELLSIPDFANCTIIRKNRLDDTEAAKNAGGVYLFQAGQENPSSSVFEVTRFYQIPGVNDDRYLHTDLVQLAQLHDMRASEDEIDKLSKSIEKKHFMSRAVLMVAFDNGGSKPEMQLVLQSTCIKQVRKHLDTFGGVEVEDEMFFFESSVNATLAALTIRDELENYRENMQASASMGNNVTKTPSLTPCANITGYGIHEGHVVFMPSTDVHWGDPVNTASKLGQDCAANGDLIISDVVYNSIVDDPRCKGLRFECLSVSKSKLKFDCYKVTRESPDSIWEDLNDSPESNAPVTRERF